MFKHLEVKNFQSHDDSHLDFHPGVNVIVGSSDSGKTALFRSMLWIIENRPLGSAYVSNWARNDKKKIITPCSVVLHTDTATIARTKTETENSYTINDTVLDTPGTDVPEEIQRILNLSEVNISKQMDKPFLVSESNAEVARFLNKVIRIDLIDQVLSKAEAHKRSHVSALKQLEERFNSIEQQVDSYHWIDDAEKAILRHESIVERYETLQEQEEALQSEIERLQATLRSIPSLDVEEATDKLQKAKKTLDSISLIEAEMEKIGAELRQATLLEHTLSVVFDTDKALDLIQQHTNLRGNYIEVSRACDDLEDDIDVATNSQDALTKNTEYLERLVAQLPSTCPVCGGPLGDTHVANHSK